LRNLVVMICVFTEFAGAFEDYGYKVNIVRNMNELEDGGVILLDDAAGNYIHNKAVYYEIAKRCPNSVFICWYWSKKPYFNPFKNMILTGEYNLINDFIDSDRRDYFGLPNFVPLRLRANEPPAKIGTYPRNVKMDYCFIGGGYRKDWVPTTGEFSGLYHEVRSNNYLSYDTRRTIYLSSMFAFGFQSDDNIKNGHLSQRIFEGLAYGCIVLCENKLAEQFTDGAVVYVSSKQDLIEKMRFYKKNPELVREKQEKGYEFTRKYGTNRYSLSFFHL